MFQTLLPAQQLTHEAWEECRRACPFLSQSPEL